MAMKTLPELLEQTRQCMKCGNCMGECPVYQETLEEPLVARGKLGLIESLGDGDIELNQRVGKILAQCLLCGTCAENCPNGVRADEIIRDARALLVDEKGLSLTKKAIFRLLETEHLLPMLVKGGEKLQNLFLKKLPDDSGLRLRFPLPYLDRRRFIPPLANEFFLDRHSGWIRAEKEIMRVGLFVGCVGNYLFPRIGEAVLRLFPSNGISLYIPKDQGCCGLPAYGSGDEATPQSLARRNIEAFPLEELDEIIAPCASCAAMLKLDYPRLFPESDPLAPKVRAFTAKVSESSRFLWKLMEKIAPPAREGKKEGRILRVTYHDPCHLRRKLGVFQEPRNLLKAQEGIEYVEMAAAHRCCGQGGSFNIAHYDLSLAILDRKMKAIEDTAADVVATACSGCLLQLMDGVHQMGLKIDVRHLLEMVGQATLL